MREQEAKEKWCPMFKAACFGSQCMMWVWAVEKSPPEGAEPGVWYAMEDRRSTTDGSCGLVGGSM